MGAGRNQHILTQRLACLFLLAAFRARRRRWGLVGRRRERQRLQEGWVSPCQGWRHFQKQVRAVQLGFARCLFASSSVCRGTLGGTPAPHPHPLPLLRLAGAATTRYHVQRKLGWGHFSTVWLTHDATVRPIVGCHVRICTGRGACVPPELKRVCHVQEQSRREWERLGRNACFTCMAGLFANHLLVVCFFLLAICSALLATPHAPSRALAEAFKSVGR